jgi:hypothetical protein
VSFLAPWALLLAAAVGVPLVLHLLRRRTGARIDFPAVRYLLRMEREHAREVKLKNLLLMMLRVGIVLAIALAAAGAHGPLPGFGHPPTAVAVVVDNSLSSAAASAEGPVLTRLVAAARNVIDGAASADKLWLVTMDGAVTGGDAGTLEAALSSLRALDGAGDATLALRRASAVVRGSGIPAQRVVVLTDAQASSWSNVTADALGGVSATVVVPSGAPGPNRALTEIATEPLHWDPRGAVRATMRGTDSTTWRVVVDGRTLARGNAQPGAAIVANLQPIARGWVSGTVELGPDELRADDVRHFAVHIGEPPAVTVDAASSVFLRGAVDALVQGGRASRGGDVLLASAEKARKPALLFAPNDPLKVADANRALERASIPWRLGARREGPAPLRGAGVDGAVARSWYVLTAAGSPSGVDTLARVGAAPWAVAGEGYVLIASAAEQSATDLPVRAAFVPWLDALLSQRLAQSSSGVTNVAPGATLRVPSRVDQLEAPDGSMRPVESGAQLEMPWTAGVHFWRRSGERVGAVVINGEASESEFARLVPAELADSLGAESVAASSESVAGATFNAGGSRTLERTFLVLALLLLLAEAFVARRGLLKTAAA